MRNTLKTCSRGKSVALTLRYPGNTIVRMRITALVAISIGLSALLFAQGSAAPGAQPGGRGGRGGAPAALPAYVVNPDRTVTFHLRAPEATAVSVSGDFTQTAVPMTKAEDGIWSVTSTALRPAIYDYSFSVNGVRTNDPSNPLVKTGDRSSSTTSFGNVTPGSATGVGAVRPKVADGPGRP